MRVALRLNTVILVLSFAMVCFTTPSSAQTDAAKTYKTNCMLCHSADGSSDSPTGKATKATDLRSDEVQKKSYDELATTIAKGNGRMPAFETKLSPEVIKSLVAYIRTLKK